MNPERPPAASKTQQGHRHRRDTMKRYAPFRFHPAFGLAAVALTAATMTLAVGVPVALSPEGPAAPTMTVARAAPGAIEVTIIPARIEVVGVRDESLAASPARDSARRASRRG